MTAEILRAWVFLLLPVLLILWRWHAQSLAPLRGRRRIAAFAARCFVLVCLVIALAEPRWFGSTARQQVMLMVDLSRSVSGEALKAAENFAERADFADAEVLWLGFAGEALTRTSPEEVAVIPAQDLAEDETRLDVAFYLAAAGFRDDRVKTAVLFSDGRGTAGEVDLPGLRDRDIRVHTVPVSPPDAPEVLVRDVVAPVSIRQNEPVRISAVIESNVATRAGVDFFRNGIRISTREMDLKEGANHVHVDDRPGSERLLHYEAGVRPQADTVAANNLHGTAVIAAGNARSLLLTDRPETARQLEWALRNEGIELDIRPAEGVPDRMSDLQNYDVVMVDNVPSSAMTRQQMDLLHSYVRDFGGGFLMLGGDEAFGLGGYMRTPIEELLPVRCDYQKEDESPSLALSLVIDRSGSMSGERMELAKSAAIAAANLLTPRDYISVVAFDGEVYPVVPVQPASNPTGTASQIASIDASGGTNLAPAMAEALSQLNTVPAKLKHVILLTDGASQDGPFFELTNEMVRANITVSAVAVGEGSHGELLSQIARAGNGRYYETADPQTIPQIFTKETMTAAKSAIQEFPFLAVPVRATDFLEGVAWENAPFLLGYVRTQAKPTSETWLLTERGDPLLSTWRYGLGMTAAFTSDARNRWAVEWLRWDGYGKFWSQFLRSLARPDSLGRLAVQTTDTGSGFRLEVDAVDSGGGHLRDADVKVQLAGPDGMSIEEVLAAGLPGRWSRAMNAAGKGVYSGQVQVRVAGELVDSRFFTFTRGYPAEYLPGPPDQELLTGLAEATGGIAGLDAARLFEADERRAPVSHELWPWFALMALLGFVGDVALRRWP